MDNSGNGTEDHQTFRSPPRRRRSTFFERRDSIAPIAYSDDILSNKKIEAEAGEDGAYNDYMNTYYLKLLSEKEAWKKEVTERRNKYHDLKVQYQITSAATTNSKSTVPFGVLTNEDIEFIKAKPDMSKLVDAQQKLHKSLLLTRELVKRVNELDNHILSHSENTVQKITDYILENSTIESIE